MKGLIVAGVAGLMGIGGVIGASAAMDPGAQPAALTAAAAPTSAAALETRIARLAGARRAVEDAGRSRTQSASTTTVEHRVAAPSRSDDALADDRGGDRVLERGDDDRGDDDHGSGRGRDEDD